MVFTLAEIEEIKAECFANDVVYNYDVIKVWDDDKIRDFFESGGGGEGAAPSTVKPADGSADPFETKMPEEVIWKLNTAKTVAVVTLNRPTAKNALDDKITEGLFLSVQRAKCTPTLRVLFLTGNGAMFCAGGDPKSFQNTAKMVEEQKQAAAEGKEVGGEKEGETFADLLAGINELPCYVVGLANGSAMGGGFGLLSICDTVVARKTAFFALSEVKLGVIPATISPYVVAKIGPSNSRMLFMTGETINADRAKEIGLVQEVVMMPEDLMKAGQKICDTMSAAAPGAVASAKELVRSVQYRPITKELMAATQAELVRVSCTEECAGGMVAVQQGKKAPWTTQDMSMPK